MATLSAPTGTQPPIAVVSAPSTANVPRPVPHLPAAGRGRAAGRQVPGNPMRWARIAALEGPRSLSCEGCVRRPTVAVFRIGMEVGERLERMRHTGALEAAANQPRHLRPVKYVQPAPVDGQGRYIRVYTQKIHKSANKL
jgi:hypothetical protein